jgi:transposase
MQNSLENLPENSEELKEMVSLLKGELQHRDILIEKLRHELAGHKRQRFGSSGESLDQLQLAFEEEEAIAKSAEKAEAAEPQEPKAKRSHNRKPLPDHLERHEHILSVGEERWSPKTGQGAKVG